MPRASNGTYTLPTAVNPVVVGTKVTANWANTTLSDIASVLTSCLDRAGRGGMQANLALGGYKITGLAAGTATGEAVNKDQLDSLQTTLENAIAAAIEAVTLDPEVDVASAATATIGGLASNKVRITGTTDISSLGTVYEGPVFIRMAASLTFLTSGNILTPFGKEMKTQAGDTFIAWPKATSGTADGWVLVPLGAYVARFRESAALGDPDSVFSATAGQTLATGYVANTSFAIYNATDANITITQGSGLTLRYSGTTTTGNRTLFPRGTAVVRVISSTEYVISGDLT